ncbi:uncharacterized protein LOC113029911 isoform X2 [Astatotilapia calliptera]|uniref:uncharacterized protein LOC113029911 isoform X2 n=1 Tax=Astatotilapia calliptera TaxID=8154 RepID=UPI000E3FDACF|nr:uncharacterized protein LOC113029911 isoform X2 [Astatotilapia calliptera]
MWLRQTAAGSRFSLLQYLSLSLLLSPCILPYPTFFLVHLSSCPLFYLSLSPLSLSHRCHITPHTCTFPLSLSLSHLPAFSLAPPAYRRLPVHLPRQSNNWLLSVLESSRKSGRRRRSRGGKGEEEELFCEASFAHPSLAAAAAASVPLPPSAAAQRPPLSLLDAPSPAGICLHLLLRELFLELGGGGRSPPPSLPRTLSEARRIVGELRRGTTLSDRRKQAPLSPSNPSFPGLMGKSWMSFREIWAVLPGCSPEEPLMEPSLTLQRGVFNQCTGHSLCMCMFLFATGA